VVENIRPDLQDVYKEDNKRFYNLLDSAKWAKLIESVKGGAALESEVHELVTGETPVTSLNTEDSDG
jgi:hypothetical protein